MKKNLKKILALVCATSLMTAMVGCGTEKKAEDNGKVSITIGNWPDETDQATLARKNEVLEKFKAKYPEIEVNTSTFKYDVKNFVVKAGAKQLPTCFEVPFTETKTLISNGYIANITDALERAGVLDKINENILKQVQDKDGNVYGVPLSAYSMSLQVNKDLFAKAGYINEDGTVKAPATYEELAEMASTIKKKTGVAGFALPTIENFGGWHFTSIAWSFGTKFMEQDKDGKWKATFDSPEFKAALQYVYDLKWKYDALLDSSAVSHTDIDKMYGTGQLAMAIGTGIPAASSQYNMPIKDISLVRLPEGPSGRYQLLGGALVVLNPDATEAEKDAIMKWLNFAGTTPAEWSAERAEVFENGLKTTAEKNRVIIDDYKRTSKIKIWVDDDAEREAKSEIAQKYINANYDDYADALLGDAILQAEEPQCAQQLYSIIDKCLQEVITNKDANIDQITKDAVNDFQTNHLDKIAE